MIRAVPAAGPCGSPSGADALVLLQLFVFEASRQRELFRVTDFCKRRNEFVSYYCIYLILIQFIIHILDVIVISTCIPISIGLLYSFRIFNQLHLYLNFVFKQIPLSAKAIDCE